MRRSFVNAYLTFAFLLYQILAINVSAQNINDTIPSKHLIKYASVVEAKVAKTEKQISNLTQSTISKLEQQEAKLYKKLYRIDSIAANNIFSEKAAHYKKNQQRVNEKTQQAKKVFSGEYIPYLDTVTNSIAFIKEGKDFVKRSENLKEKIYKVSSSVTEFNNKVQQTEDIKKYIRERKEFLNQQLSKYTSLNKDLVKLNKTVFYYGQQIKELKEAIKDPKKAEQKVLSILRQSKVFQEFIKKNSFLAGVFDIPTDYGTAGVGNLQTRAQVDQFIQTRMTISGSSSQQQIQQGIQTGQEQLQQLKTAFPFLSETGEMPAFKVNESRMKPFLKRLEYGVNIQMKKGQSFVPNRSEIGLQMGYKIHQKSTASIGVTYFLGVGTGFNNIRLSNQGLGLRAMLDMRLKGSFFINGGYEQNYLAAFQGINDLKNRNSWNYSSLIGISKKYKMGKKLNGSVMILYDFLYRQNLPAQPFIFRTGYSF